MNENDMDQNDNAQNKCPTIFDCLSPRCGTVLAAVTADIIADGLNSTQIAAIGGFITIVGDALGYIAAQMELNEQACAQRKHGI